MINLFCRRHFFSENVSRISQNCYSTSAEKSPQFSLSQEQTKRLEMVEKFVREEIIPNAAHHDQTGDFPVEVFKKAWKLGLNTGVIPANYGGKGLQLHDLCMIDEKLAYGCSGIALVIGVSKLAQAPVILFGNEQQKKEYLGRHIVEPLVCSYAVTEPEAGSDVSGIKTRAEKTSDGDYILNGQKMWITSAGYANWYFVLARTNPDPEALASEAFTGFIVERDSVGVSVGHKENNMGQRASDTRGVTFENVIVPKKNVLLQEGNGFKIAMGAFDLTRPPTAAGAVGVAQRAFDEATKYFLQKQTLNSHLIGGFDVPYKLAKMAIGIENARLAYQRAAWEFDQGRRNTYYASIAKCLAGDVVNQTTGDAVRIFGAEGYNSDYPVEKLMRDAKIFQIFEGTSQIQRTIIMKELFRKAQNMMQL